MGLTPWYQRRVDGSTLVQDTKRTEGALGQRSCRLGIYSISALDCVTDASPKQDTIC